MRHNKLTISILVLGFSLGIAHQPVIGLDEAKVDLGNDTIEFIQEPSRESKIIATYRDDGTVIRKCVSGCDNTQVPTELDKTRYVSKQLIVKFSQNQGIHKEINSSAAVADLITELSRDNTLLQAAKFKNSRKILDGSMEGIDRIGLRNWYVLDFENDVDIEMLASNLRKVPEIECAEPNYIYRTFFTPNDPLYSYQWSHQKIASELGWDIQIGSSNVTIAIIDTGVDYNHEDLSSNVLPGYDFVNLEEFGLQGYCDSREDCTVEDNNPMDFYGHGTHCAGIAAAKGNNGVGVAGACWNCKILPIRAGWQGTNGYGYLVIEDIVQAINYAVANGAHIISMSLGGSYSQVMKEALDNAYLHGIVLIAAAGNSYRNIKSYPAAFDNVIAVAATDQNDDKATFSNYGSWVDVAAPGVKIASTVPTTGGTATHPSGYLLGSGTSMATPLVAGIAGLIKSQNPDFTNEQIYSLLRTATDDPTSNVYIGTGRVNMFEALQFESIPIAKIDSSHDDIRIRNSLFLYGTAKGQDFVEYILQYGQGVYPSAWTTALTSTEPKEQSLLGNLSISGLADGIISIRLLVKDIHNNIAEDRVSLWLDSLLKEGWPYKTNGAIISSAATADINNDGDKEVIIGSMDGKIHVISANGSALSGWPVDTGCFQVGLSSPAIADIDKDMKFDIIVYTGRGLLVLNGDGTIKWSKTLFPGIGSNVRMTSPVVEDLDNDENLEIIIGHDSTIHIFNHHGNYYSSPKDLSPALTLFSTPAVADLDGDGNKEIIVQTNNFTNNVDELYILSKDAKILFGPYILGKASLGPSPVIGDIDQDSKLEILAVTAKPFLGENAKVYAFESDGSLVSTGNWPANITFHALLTALALGDIDNDGRLEVIVGVQGAPYEENVIVLEDDGSLKSNQPMSTGFCLLFSEPIAANLSSDAGEEVVIGTGSCSLMGQGRLGAWTVDGVDLSGFPKEFIWSIDGTAATDDLDGDGKVELIVGDDEGYVYAWDFDESYDASRQEWPVFRHDRQHTGSYNYKPASIINVPGDYTSIQEAINAAHYGDTVYVSPGAYYEHQIQMKEGVSVIGTSPTNTIIDGQGNQNIVVCQNINKALLSGFTIKNSSGSAILIENSSPEIKNNIILNGGNNRILIQGDPIIKNNTILNNKNGIQIYSTPALVSLPIIKNNIIVNNIDYGIFASTSYPIISYNDVYNNIKGNYYGCSPGQGNFSADPKFEGNNNYYLRQEDSPCIDTGDPTDDYSLEPQPNGNRINLGAYGNTPEATISARSIIHVDDDNTSGNEAGTPEFPYNTVQEGIHAAHPGYTKTVSVAAGNYYEYVILYKDALNLIGEGAGKSIIEGAIGIGDINPGLPFNQIISGFTINAKDSGVGIICRTGTQPTIRNNIIYGGNCDGGYCAGIVAYKSSPKIINNTIVGNTYGIILDTSSSIIRNNIIVNNIDFGIFSSTSYPKISYNDVYNNTLNYYGCSPGLGDISADPKFKDPANRDYHEKVGSPCVDAGDPSDNYSQEPAPNGNRINMGAYGNTPEATITYTPPPKPCKWPWECQRAVQ